MTELRRASVDSSLRSEFRLAAWAIAAAVILAINLGSYPLLDADEGLNAEVGREMAATNDYVMPRLDGMPYLDKPIVYFAAEAAVMEVTGPTEFAARFPAWLFTIATGALLAWFAMRIGVDPAATAIMFLSMPLTIAFARTVIFDSALSFFINAALIAFYLERPTLAWAAMAFGVITKGPVAIALPLLVAIPYAIWHKRARTLISIGGVILFVVIITPWVWAVSLVVPDFLKYVLVTETAQRLTTPALKRTGAIWYFVPYVLGGALPWVFSVGTAFSRSRPAEAGPHTWRERFLWLWLIVPFVFFSLSQSKRPQYVLPLMAPIALLAASRLRTRAAGIAVAIFGALILAAIPFAKIPFGKETAIILGAAALICGLIGIFTKPSIAVITISIPALLIPIITTDAMRSVAAMRSEKAFVANLHPKADIVGIRSFTGSMMFYLQRPIIVVSPTGEELTSNYIIRHYSDFSARVKPPQWLDTAFSRPDTLFIVRK